MPAKYLSALAELMSQVDSVRYTRVQGFERSKLLLLTPAQIVRFFNYKTYGDANPPETARPEYCRANTLEYLKKAISHFMPRKNAVWDPIRMEGNPTRSSEVNEMIRKVKKFEVRREGVRSSARRPLEFDEFLTLLSVLRNDKKNLWRKYRASSALTLQWSLITRVDDIMKMKYQDFFHNIQHPFALSCRMRWSKNITEERDSPEKIILGSMDVRLCPLLNLAVYLEVYGKISTTPPSDFLFGSPNDGHKVLRNTIGKVFNSPDFVKLKEGLLGTHSIRKGAATYASRCGMFL